MFAKRALFIVASCLIFPISVYANTQANDDSGFSYRAYFAPEVCPIPTYPKVDLSLHQGPENSITIQAKNSILEKNQLAKFDGGVTLIAPNQTIVASEVEINRNDSLINAQGNIHFSNDAVDIFADQLTASDSSNATTVTNASYQLTDSLGHGKAGEISITNQGTVSLLDSTYTTCYGEKPEWALHASTINLIGKDKRIEAYNVRLSIFDVPVMYFPYFSMPVTTEKQTGFLTPKISSSDDTGLEIETPFFVNISDSMDATLTPRFMSARGTQLLTEFRYLVNQHYGEINLEYLPNDKEWQSSNSHEDEPRYLARLEHIGTFSERFRTYIDVTTIGDDNYLADIGSEQYNENDNYLYQIGELSYFADSWNATLQLQDFEILGNHDLSYRTVPHIEINSSRQLDFYNTIFDIHSELTHFDTPEEDKATADRYHIEAGFTLPMSHPAWFLNSEVKLLHTHYQQRNIQPDSMLEKTVSRTLPKVRVHGGIFLERDSTLFGRDYLQTIEPQLQYLYVSDVDQSNIGLYDTTGLQDDYNGLFRDTRYSGLDRIAQANQYSWGLTSRMFNQKNNEIFRLSFGQIVYLDESDFETSTSVNERSALATELYMRVSRKLQLSTSIQYDTKNELTSKSQSNIDYRFNRNSTMQLNHRYVRDVSNDESEQVTIEQVSLIANTKLNTNWHFIGRVSTDLQQDRNIESFAGFEYKNCCWGIRAAVYRQQEINLDDNNLDTDVNYDNGFKIEFVYNGLADSNDANGITNMLRSSIFGYKRPYFLNN